MLNTKNLSHHYTVSSLCLLIPAVLYFGLNWSALEFAKNSEVYLELDVESQSKANLQSLLYLNGPSGNLEVKSLTPGTRQILQWKLPEPSVNSLRWDPSIEGSFERIRIFAIHIRGYGKTLDFGPEQLSQFSAVGADLNPTKDYLEILPKTGNVSLYKDSLNIRLSSKFKLRTASFLKNFTELSTLLKISVLALLLTLFLLWRLPTLKKPILLSLGTWFGLCLLGKGLLKYVELDQDVSRVLGHAVFHGSSYQVCSYILFLFLFSLFGMGCYWGRGSSFPTNLLSERSPGNEKIFFVGPILLILLFYFPSMSGEIQKMLSFVQIPLWDWDNMAAFEFHIHRGDIPFKDFFFPYSGNFIFGLPLPWGPLFYFVSNSFLVIQAFYAFGRLLNSWAVAGISILLLLHFSQIGWFSTYDRMFIPISIILSFLATQHFSKNILSRDRCLFGLSLAWGIFLEPTLVIYCGVAIFLVVTVQFLSSQGPSRREKLQGWLKSLIIPVAGLALWLVVANHYGAIEGLKDWILSMKDVAQYMAIPTDLMSGLTFPKTQYAFYIFSFSIFLFLGSYIFVTHPFHVLGSTLVAVSAVGFMALQKYAVRPIEYQIFYVFILNFVILTWYLLRPKFYLTLTYLGLCIGIASTLPINPSWTSRLSQTPGKILDLFRQPDPSQANQQRFSANRFVYFKEQKELLAHINSILSTKNIFALTDDPILYILKNQQPPYMSNSFSVSPIFEQKKVTTWIDKNNPEFVVINPARLFSDGIHGAVRLPKIYEKVATTFEFSESFGPYKVFRKTDTTPTNAAIWLDLLQNKIEMGSIPKYVKIDQFRPCVGVKSECAPLILMAARKPNPNGILNWKIGDKTLRVIWETNQKTKTLAIPLGQVFLWPLIANNFNLADLDLNSLQEDYQITVKNVAVDPHRLY